MPTFATTTRLKSLMGMAAGVTFYDTSLGLVGDFAEDYVARRCGLRSGLVAVITGTEYPEVYGPGQRTVLLKHTPIVAIAAVTNGDYAVPTSERRHDTETGELFLTTTGAYWSEDVDGVEVHYGYGYASSADVPIELQRCCDMVAIAAFNKAPRMGIATQSEAGQSYHLDEKDIPAEALAILAAYRDAHHP
jgi:hypothetical protein